MTGYEVAMNAKQIADFLTGSQITIILNVIGGSEMVSAGISMRDFRSPGRSSQLKTLDLNRALTHLEHAHVALNEAWHRQWNWDREYWDPGGFMDALSKDVLACMLMARYHAQLGDQEGVKSALKDVATIKRVEAKAFADIEAGGLSTVKAMSQFLIGALYNPVTWYRLAKDLMSEPNTEVSEMLCEAEDLSATRERLVAVAQHNRSSN